MKKSILLVGCGGIGSEVIKKLSGDKSICVDQVLVRAESRIVKISDQMHQKVITSVNNLSHRPDFVLECASHKAVADFGPYFLERGIDFGIVSVGALSDPSLYQKLQSASEKGNSKLFIIPGAIGGIDLLSAAGVDNLEEVSYSARKPPLSWLGTPAEENIDLKNILEAKTIYEGDAREAAMLYPKNANVTATVALAGLGFDQTRVKLVADPNITKNIHHIEANGSFGEFEITVKGNALKSNPKTSSLTAYSAVRAIKNRIKSTSI